MNGTYRIAQFFDGENIDGQHLGPPVLAMLLETTERENFDGLLYSNISHCTIWCTWYVGTYSVLRECLQFTCKYLVAAGVIMPQPDM